MNIPEGMSFETAAAIPEAWVTAYQLLKKVSNIQPGETALIMAGASGVGTVLIQMCKYFGAHSIAVCSSWEKLERCK
jgi:tumor protein p53-inducible protein 3